MLPGSVEEDVWEWSVRGRKKAQRGWRTTELRVSKPARGEGAERAVGEGHRVK